MIKYDTHFFLRNNLFIHCEYLHRHITHVKVLDQKKAFKTIEINDWR